MDSFVSSIMMRCLFALVSSPRPSARGVRNFNSVRQWWCTCSLQHIKWALTRILMLGAKRMFALTVQMLEKSSFASHGSGSDEAAAATTVT
jgi:hypothetical protein